VKKTVFAETGWPTNIVCNHIIGTDKEKSLCGKGLASPASRHMLYVAALQIGGPCHVTLTAQLSAGSPWLYSPPVSSLLPCLNKKIKHITEEVLLNTFNDWSSTTANTRCTSNNCQIHPMRCWLCHVLSHPITVCCDCNVCGAHQRPPSSLLQSCVSESDTSLDSNV